MQNITFLGMGAMGTRMVAHLIKANYRVTVCNRSEAAMAPHIANGALSAQTPAIAAKDADIVISMVRDDEASRYVWLDEQSGALNRMAPHAIAIESSTLTPAWARELADACRRRGIRFADAPVAGSRPQAEAAKLIYLVGAEVSVFEAIEPILSVMGAAAHHAGAPGAGTNVKLAINGLLGVQLTALAELLGMLKSSGMDLDKAFDIIAQTPVCSMAVKLAGAAMIAGQYAPSFPIELVEKDFSYIESTATAVDATTPLTTATLEVLRHAMALGYANDNITGIAQLYLD